MTTRPDGVSRRSFLHHVSAAGGAVATYHALHALGLVSVPTAYAGPPPLTKDSGRGARVVILGGGIAGLVSAYELRKAGYRVTVLEARGRPGGRVFTVRRGSAIDELDSRQVASWDAGPDMFFDAGAARLPQYHQGIIGYARELDVPLEVLSNQNRNALVRDARAFAGAPQRNARVHADTRGFVAELAAKAVHQDSFSRPLSEEDKLKVLTLIKEFGSLEADLVYRGSARGGYREMPGGGASAGVSQPPLELAQLFQAGFWTQLSQIEESPYQLPTMLRPVGGMAKIAEAIARSLGKIVRYHSEVSRVRRAAGSDGGRVEYTDTKTGQRATLEADHIIVTLQPGLLGALDSDFSPRFRQALAAPTGSPLAKVAFQARRRFWELDEQIYGGISWTDHPITQVWYPSNGIHEKKGILVGAYVFFEGDKFADLPLDARLEHALEGGETLHPGNYRQHLEHGVSVSWKKVKYSSGATTHWSDEARKNEYPVLLEPDGPYYFAGEYLSYINGWQEGALRSAHHAIGKLAARQQERANKKETKV